MNKEYQLNPNIEIELRKWDTFVEQNRINIKKELEERRNKK